MNRPIVSRINKILSHQTPSHTQKRSFIHLSWSTSDPGQPKFLLRASSARFASRAHAQGSSPCHRRGYVPFLWPSNWGLSVIYLPIKAATFSYPCELWLLAISISKPLKTSLYFIFSTSPPWNCYLRLCRVMYIIHSTAIYWVLSVLGPVMDMTDINK